MTRNAPIELPTGYYLDNFQRLLDTVLERYDDLLDATDTEFVTRFRSLDRDAARLLVRLYTRKGPYFRLSKLNYPEIDDCANAARRLADTDLIDDTPQLEAGEIGRLLTLPELRELDWVPKPRRGKAELLIDLDAMTERRTSADWGVRDRILAPSHWLTLRRLQLMYFGNEQQSLTDFVLSDLGVFHYEEYPLDRDRRWFNASFEIEQQLLINDHKTIFYEAQDQADTEQLQALARELLDQDWCDAVTDRAHRLNNRLGYRLEQMGDWDLAMALLRTNEQPPARERRCRILYKQQEYQSAWDQLIAMQENPLDATEVRFVQRFQPRLGRKLKQAVHTPPPTDLIEHRVSWPRGDGYVEQIACAHLDDAVWLENLLPLAIFGLVHWSWVFAEVAGAFHHPFQQGPADLYQADFLERRGTDRHSLYQSLDRSRARELLIHHWELKQYRLNPFVHWEALDRELVLRCFDAMPWDHWLAIFRHLWLDLRRHRSGFPDLFQFTDAGYRFIEIKGPGDRLQDNQRDWLAVFAAAGIPAEVWYVDWAGA